jgi:cytochrome b561
VTFPVDQFPRENVSSPNRRGMTNFAKRHYNRIGQALYLLVAPRIRLRFREPARPIDLSDKRSPTPRP